MGEDHRIVGIAEYKTARNTEKLAAYGLGSCVAVALYDSLRRTGGMAHVMLPSSRLHAQVTFPGKFADTALEALVEELEKAGSPRKDLTAKIVGGSNMFSSIVQVALPIGLRNVAAARAKLGELGIPIVGEAVGGVQGRTIVFSLEDGQIEIRQLAQPVQYI
jgi:chemotaxis protein CheD